VNFELQNFNANAKTFVAKATSLSLEGKTLSGALALLTNS
jgi:hypothetical protein